MPRKKSPHGSKTAFVLSMPEAAPRDVVEAAEKAGIKMKENYVHTIRYNARVKAGKGGRRAKKRGRAASNGKQTASDFVRHKPGMAAKEIVALAKQAGIKLSERYVYVIRSSDRSRGRLGAHQGWGRDSGRAAETSLRRAIAELGLVRARQVLADVESAFGR
jgi:hypothetical protein